MNKKQLVNLGITGNTADVAVSCIKKASLAGFLHGRSTRRVITDIIDNPEKFTEDDNFSDLAKALTIKEEPYTPTAIDFPIWGDEIDINAIEQMKVACQLPTAVAGALMPDCHLGYGLPIGGVLATENSVVPYCVGVDIGCMVRLTVIDIPPHKLEANAEKFENALENGTMFGIGGNWQPRCQHEVMDRDWNITAVTKQMKDRAWSQLGTSGSGNHFAEWGILTLNEPDLGLEAGKYIALMSHSGSRGAGAEVCKFYSNVATQRLYGQEHYEHFKNLGWLMMDSEAGQEYWQAMNLMGEYATANHACLHQNVLYLAKAAPLLTIENHHNLCWLENHNGKDVYVHRKGATPAGKGVLGVIPGSMADPAYVVRGKGTEASLMSSSHGAGRRMSRKQAIKDMKWDHWRGVLRQRGVKLLSAGIDEMPGVYKDIRKVMKQQQDLVDIVAQFDPKIVKMADGGRAED